MYCVGDDLMEDGFDVSKMLLDVIGDLLDAAFSASRLPCGGRAVAIDVAAAF